MSLIENKIDYTKKELPKKVFTVGITLVLVGLLLVVLAYLSDSTRSAFNNLVLLMFVASIGVGSLFLIAIEYIAGAVWSVPFRRVVEFLASVVLILPIIAIPIVFNLHDLFHWTHNEVVANDAMLSGKAPYLNENFFIVRMVIYFFVWILFYVIFTSISKKQDKTKEQSLTTKNIKTSAIFIPFFALTVTFAAIDWIMSLEPHWFSTIFGVYYFSGTVLAALAAATYIIVNLNERGYFVKGLGKDHYYSLGALLFAFTNFWAYIAFSQFLLIWYANLPEETFWFLNRWEGSWVYVSVGIVFIRFLIPYIGLVAQPSKMNPKRLKSVAIWILFAHLYDLYWLIMPTYSPDGAVFSWYELGFPLLGVGVVILFFNMRTKNENLVAIGDPKLQRGIDFTL